MPHAVQEIFDHADELDERFEAAPEDERDPQAFVALVLQGDPLAG